MNSRTHPGEGRRTRNVRIRGAQTRAFELRYCAVTMRRLFAAGELPEQRLALLVAEATQAAAVGDLQLLHDLCRPDLPNAGHCLQHGRHPKFTDDIIGLRAVEHGGKCGLALLELLLQLSASLTDLSRLFQSGCALFRAQ